MIWKDFLQKWLDDDMVIDNNDRRDFARYRKQIQSDLKQFFSECVLETEKEVQVYLNIINEFKKEGTPIDYEVNKLSELRGVLRVYKELSEGLE